MTDERRKDKRDLTTAMVLAWAGLLLNLLTGFVLGASSWALVPSVAASLLAACAVMLVVRVWRRGGPRFP